MRRALARLAAGVPVRTFAVAGIGAREAVQDLRSHPELSVVASPRSANVLLVAGHVPDGLREPLARVHDQMSHPRATVWWPSEPSTDEAPPIPAVEVHDDPVRTIVPLNRELVAGRCPSELPLLADAGLAEWQGVGPYGQGGSRMTGGTPYGRPMAELAPDREGLRLDAVPVPIGPFFPGLPVGLVLELSMAGDVVHEVDGVTNLLNGDWAPMTARPGLRPFLRALEEPVPIAELEMARARDHLRWLADALDLHGLPALGVRAIGLATALRPSEAADVRSLGRWAERTQVLRWSTGGVGHLPAETLAGLGAGPVARAAGIADDARSDDPSHRAIGFEPIVQDAGDAAARWRQRLSETAQSLDLAERAGERLATPGVVESPRGRLETGSAPTARTLCLIPRLIQASNGATGWRRLSAWGPTSRRPPQPSGWRRRPCRECVHVGAVAVLAVGLAMLAGVYFVAVLHRLVFVLVTGSRPSLPVALALPAQSAALLLQQERRSTERTDAAGAALAPALYASLAAAIAFVMIAVFLHGWSPNSLFAMHGAYRYAALALSFQMPFLLAMLATALPAESLSIVAIAEAQESM